MFTVFLNITGRLLYSLGAAYLNALEPTSVNSIANKKIFILLPLQFAIEQLHLQVKNNCIYSAKDKKVSSILHSKKIIKIKTNWHLSSVAVLLNWSSHGLLIFSPQIPRSEKKIPMKIPTKLTVVYFLMTCTAHTQDYQIIIKEYNYKIKNHFKFSKCLHE